MVNDYESGMNYVYGDLEQYNLVRYLGITKTSSNLHKIPENWILRFYWADKKGNCYLRKENGRKICIDINSHREFEEGDKHAVLYEILREIKEFHIKGSKEFCSNLEEIVQRELRKNIKNS